MFPFRDHNPSLRPAYVTYALIAMNIVVYLMMLPSYDTQAIGQIYYDWALVPALISEGENLHGVFTSICRGTFGASAYGGCIRCNCRRNGGLSIVVPESAC